MTPRLILAMFGAGTGIYGSDDFGMLQRQSIEEKSFDMDKILDEVVTEETAFNGDDSISGWEASDRPWYAGKTRWKPGALPYAVTRTKTSTKDIPSTMLDRLQTYLSAFNEMEVGIKFVNIKDVEADETTEIARFVWDGHIRSGLCGCSADRGICQWGCLGRFSRDQEKKMVNTELAHLLGMFNEQQRYDRDKHIKIFPHCIANHRGGLSHFTLIKDYYKTGPYDPYSIVHSQPNDFKHPRCAGRAPTMQLKDFRSVGARSPTDYGPRRGEFTELDQKYLKYLYWPQNFYHGCNCKKEWQQFGWDVKDYCVPYNYTDPMGQTREVGVCALLENDNTPSHCVRRTFGICH